MKKFFIAGLAVVFVLLAVLFLRPKPKELDDIESIINEVKFLRQNVKFINATYELNISSNTKTTKSIFLTKNESLKTNYEFPDIFFLYNKSIKKYYSGDLYFLNRSCWSLIFETDNLFYIICLDKESGYPLAVFLGNKTFHSELVVKTIKIKK